MYFKKRKHPELFQGNKKTDHYFEGWYYKLVSYDLKTSVAFIPGISINKSDPHAFIQVFISSNNHIETHYIRYESNQFTYSHDSFMVQIEKQLFTKNKIEIDIENKGIQIYGLVTLNEHTPIKKNLYAPNIMGPFAYLPFMECNHAVISMQSLVLGEIIINGDAIDFNYGKAYLEKDWGKSFPKDYIWLQSNHFEDNDTSLMFSYATIPFMGLSFKGLIVNLVYQDKEYRFSTYNFAKIIKKEIGDQSVDFIIKRGLYKLHIYAKKDKEIELKSPLLGTMSQTIKEGLSGIIKIKLYKKDVLIYEDVGQNSGIEIMMASK